MLYLFDLDGTLISGYMDNFDRDYDTWDILPGRKAMLNRLLMRGDTMCVITNQRGVAFGYVTVDQVHTKIYTALRKLGIAPVRSSGDPLPEQVYVCLSDVAGQPPWNHPDDAARGKPEASMILEAIMDHPDAAQLGVLMVGDRPEDEEAARRANVPFRWARIFFGA